MGTAMACGYWAAHARASCCLHRVIAVMLSLWSCCPASSATSVARMQQHCAPACLEGSSAMHPPPQLTTPVHGKLLL